MCKIVLILSLMIVGPALPSEAEQAASNAMEEHIEKVVNELPPDSLLRRQLIQGARGTGVRYPWMDELREKNIKRAVVCVDITFDKQGRPKQMSVSSTHYFPQYEGDGEVLESERSAAIRGSNLEKQLEDLALKEAAHGLWLDVPRPKPFVGDAKIEFLDDEWLAVPPLFYGVSNPASNPHTC